MFTNAIQYEASGAPVATSIVTSMHSVAWVQIVCVVVGMVVCLLLPKIHNKKA